MRVTNLTLAISAMLFGTFTVISPGAAMGQNQSVTVVFEKIFMIDDSDDLSDGDVCLGMWVNSGRPGGQGAVIERSMGTGNTYPLNKTLGIDNAPDELILSVTGRDSDVSILGCERPTDVPRLRVESNDRFDANYADHKMNLAQFPGANRRKSFQMTSKPGGRIRFTVYGRIEITRTPPPQATISGKTVNTDPGEMTTIRTIPGKPPRTVRKIGKTKFHGNYITTTPYGVFEMVLSSGGNDKVTGTFSGNGSTGTISGTLFGDTLIFRWSQDGGKYKGTGKFVLADNGQSFTGTYNNSNDPDDTSAGHWNGKRR